MKFKTEGVCTKIISYNIRNNKIYDVVFKGGCSGNTQGLSRLLEGMDVSEVIERLGGIECGNKQTSCPDQLTKILSREK